MPKTIDTLRAWIGGSSHIVVLTGAGISTESGIPDFRGPQGVWTKNPKAERLSNIHYYMSDPEVRKLSWQSRLDHPAWQARPNAGHMALVDLEKVVEVHGTVREVICMNCEWRGPMGPVLDRVRAGEEDPACKECGGILKSATISFGQALIPEIIDRAMVAAERADLLLAVGSSLQVYPVAHMVPIARAARARVVIVNAEPTPYDEIADAVLRESIGAVLPRLCCGG